MEKPYAPQKSFPPEAAPANSGLSSEDAARLEKTLREVSEKAEKAESAAEKAWNAAQLAADAAQSVDAAQKIMNEQAENISSGDDPIPDDKEESLPDENISQEPVCENLEENNSTEGEINSTDEDSAAFIEPEEDSSFDDTNISDETEQDDSGKVDSDAEETAANAEKAVNAAQKAWGAAQKAADSAQAADAAQKYISEITESLNDEAGVGSAEEDNSSTSDSSYDEFMEQISKMLPIISRILENKDDAKKYEREIALFKRLRAMGDILPEEKKHDFLCSHARLLLDYLIARLSGKPGLLITSKALRKTDVMHGMLDEVSPEDEKLYGRELILKVFADLQRLLPYLPDDNLSKALMNESETLIDRI